jgi:hypothetical protein
MTARAIRRALGRDPKQIARAIRLAFERTRRRDFPGL